jgi:phosphoribosylaminoimidazolecarboxamide formyltransferase/IMP cyclohydrolase
VSAADTAEGRRPIRRALVSVYDKAGLVELAAALDQAGVTIVSTGSTAKAVAAQGIPVTAVEELTGFPECLDGRVKTLHPKVHAGILADTDNPEHLRQLANLGVESFDLVVSNLYPFRDTVASGAAPRSASSRSTSAVRRWFVPPRRTTRALPSSPALPHTRGS